MVRHLHVAKWNTAAGVYRVFGAAEELANRLAYLENVNALPIPLTYYTITWNERSSSAARALERRPGAPFTSSARFARSGLY